MAYFGMSPDEELRWIDTVNDSRDRARAAAALWDSSQAKYANDIARAAPWMPAGAVLALAKGNASPGAVMQAARAAAARKARYSPSGARPGELITGAQLWPGHPGMLATRNRGRARNRGAVSGDDRRQPMATTVRMDPRNDPRLRGLLDEDGRLVAPTNIGSFTEPGGGNFSESRLATVAPSKFNNVMRFRHVVSEAAGEDGKVEFITPDGSVGIFDAKTGSFYDDPETTYDKVNPFDLGAALAPVGEFLSDRRLPLIPGVPEVPGAPRTAGGVVEANVEALGNAGDWLQNRRAATAPGVPQTAGAPADIGGYVQQTAMLADAPVQEFQGQVRNAYGALHGRDVDWWEAQSDYLIAAGSDMDPGDGLLVDPDSEVARERRRREEERGQIGGQNVTLGRWAASTVVEPGSQGYRVLSGLVDLVPQIYDPTAKGLGGAADILDARKVFAPDDPAAAVGLIRGSFSRGVHRQNADAFLNGRAGSSVVKRIAEQPSPGQLWRDTGRKLHPREVTALADADTTAKARGALEPMLGTRFRTADDIWQSPSAWADSSVLGRRRGESRLLADTPGTRIDLDDPTSAMRETELWLKNAHVPDEVQLHFLDRLARSNSRNDTFKVIGDAMSHTEGVLAKAGVPKTVRDHAVKMFENTSEDQQKWFVDEFGDNVSVWHDVAVGDDVISAGGPHLWNEHIGRYIPLPDFREVRRLTSKFPNMAWNAEGKLRFPSSLLMAMQDDIWKPFQLLRAAWPVRVIGEEQLRMGAASWNSMFRHPASFISWAVGRRTDALGEPFDEADDFRRAMSKRTGGWLEDRPGRVRTGQVGTFVKGQHEEHEYLGAWAEELLDLHNDPVARQVVNSETLDEAEAWFVNGQGRKFLDELTDAHPVLSEPGAPRRYLESVEERVRVKTGGEVDLVDSIRSGTLGGHKIFDPDTMRATKHGRDALGRYIDVGPEKVKGDKSVYMRSAEGRGVAAGWRNGVDFFFTGLMTKPTNYLSRSPVFKQAYWKRVEEMIPFAAPDAKAAILANANGLGSRQVRRLSRAKAVGRLTADEVDAYAKGFGLDETKELLYDLSKKSQIADSMRLVAPFGEAWREVITRWNKLGPNINASASTADRLRGGKNMRRAQQIVQGARGEDLGEVLGAPEGQGFFHKDQFGEERFYYPGSQWLMQNAPGGPHMPIPLSGRVKGLSMISEILPGIGPVASVPVAAFLPDKPGIRRELRRHLLPYGSVSDEEGGDAQLQLLNFAPPWMRNVFMGAEGGGFDMETNRLYANTVMDVAAYLSSTGKYDMSTPGGQNKLMSDAQEKAKAVYMMRGLVQFGAPAAPSPEFLMKSDEGLIELAILRDEFYKMMDEDPDGAVAKFVARFGDRAAAAMQPNTRSVQGGIAPTQPFGDWEKAHGDIKAEFPTTWAFFGPQGNNDEFDYATYARQIREGQREALTLKEWLRLSQDRLGNMWMDQAYEKVGDDPSEGDRAWLREIEGQIRKEYPGYGDRMGVAERADPETLFAELGDAVKDERVLDTEAGKGLALYWEARQKVVDYATEEGYAGIDRADDLAGDREWLHGIGERVAEEYPDFAPMWDQLLRREVEGDA